MTLPGGTGNAPRPSAATAAPKARSIARTERLANVHALRVVAALIGVVALVAAAVRLLLEMRRLIVWSGLDEIHGDDIGVGRAVGSEFKERRFTGRNGSGRRAAQERP